MRISVIFFYINHFSFLIFQHLASLSSEQLGGGAVSCFTKWIHQSTPRHLRSRVQHASLILPWKTSLQHRLMRIRIRKMMELICNIYKSSLFGGLTFCSLLLNVSNEPTMNYSDTSLMLFRSFTACSLQCELYCISKSCNFWMALSSFSAD